MSTPKEQLSKEQAEVRLGIHVATQRILDPKHKEFAADPNCPTCREYRRIIAANTPQIRPKQT